MAEQKRPAWLKLGEGFAEVTLSRPIDIEGAKVTTIRMREPLVDDQIVSAESKGSEARKEVTFFANLCELSPADVGRLPVREYARLQTAFGFFID